MVVDLKMIELLQVEEEVVHFDQKYSYKIQSYCFTRLDLIKHGFKWLYLGVRQIPIFVSIAQRKKT